MPSKTTSRDKKTASLRAADKKFAQSNHEFNVLNTIQGGLFSRSDKQAKFDLVGRQIGEIYQPEIVIIAEFDFENELEIFRYLMMNDTRQSLEPQAISQLSRYLIKTLEPIVENNYAQSTATIGLNDLPGVPTPQSFIRLPLVINDSAAGYVGLQTIDQERVFTTDELGPLEALTGALSVALENIQLREEKIHLKQLTLQLDNELAVINIVQQGLVAELDIQAIYEMVGDQIRDLFDAQLVLISTFDHKSDLRHVNYLLEKGERFFPDPKPFNNLHRYLIESRRSVLINEDIPRAMADLGMEFIGGDPETLPKSVIFVPMVVGNDVKGYISLQHVDRDDAFSQTDMRLLTTLANSMSVALENARLFGETSHLLDETQQRNNELAVINTIQQALAAELDIQAIYDLVGNQIRELFDAQVVMIGTFQHDDGLEHFPYLFEKGERYYPEPRPLDGLRRHLIRTRQLVLINEHSDEVIAKYGLRVVPGTQSPKCSLYVPLVVGDTVTGHISLQNVDRAYAFSDSDVRLLSTLANSMSVALENARLFDETNRLLAETEQQADEMITVNTVSKAIVSEVQLDNLIELIGEQTRRLFGADIVYVALYDAHSNMIHFQYNYGEELESIVFGEGLTSRIIQTAEPMLINEDISGRHEELDIEKIGADAKSYLGVPIMDGKNAIGVISVQSKRAEGRFDQSDMRLLATIASNVGAAIQNARLFSEVQRQRKYSEALVQNSPAAIIAGRSTGHIIETWNPAAEQLFGYSREEAVGKNIDDLVAFSKEIRDEATEFGDLNAEGEVVRAITQRTRKDGTMVDVELVAQPVTVDGEEVGIIAIYHDITELLTTRRAAEEARFAAEHAREEAEKANQAKSVFLANMSHELRTPLNAIIGFTRIVKRKAVGNLPERQLDNLEKVLVSAEHLLALINKILDIAKIEAGRMDVQPHIFHLKPLLEACVITAQPLVKTGVALEYEVEEGLPPLHSDQEKVKQILLNLLSNAAKFTHQGQILVSASRWKPDSEEDIEKFGTDELLAIRVDDSGIGIPAEKLEAIFGEFQQADSSTTRKYGGTGLGLSISQKLANLLGGTLFVGSEEEKGSTFTLVLPIRYQEGSPESHQSLHKLSMKQVIDAQGPVILAIDDDPNTIYLLQEHLGEAGYQVMAALDPNEGLALARKHLPYAITLDIKMPNKDGWQVLHELKVDDLTKDIPVILLTIVDKEALGYRLGADDYLIKPLDESAVLAALNRIALSRKSASLKRILVVDDDPDVIDLVRQLLAGTSYDFQDAVDGFDALEIVVKYKPDIILLDLLMPGLDGFGFIEQLRQRPDFAYVPIIVLTAKTLSNDERESLQNSVFNVIQKQGLKRASLINELETAFTGSSG